MADIYFFSNGHSKELYVTASSFKTLKVMILKVPLFLYVHVETSSYTINVLVSLRATRFTTSHFPHSLPILFFRRRKFHNRLFSNVLVFKPSNLSFIYCNRPKELFLTWTPFPLISLQKRVSRMPLQCRQS